MDKMVDRYPSRLTDGPSIIGRRDPVVHSDPDTRRAGPLSEADLQAYERDGFLALPGYFDRDEVETLRAELDRLWEVHAESDAAHVIRETNSKAVRSIFAVHRDSPVFRRLARDRRLLGIARQLLGGEVYIHQSRINYKPGFAGNGFYWHSDFETWHAEDGMPRMRAVSASIALTENTPNNGPLMLVPGSHHYYVCCVGETPEDNYKTSLQRQSIGVPDNDSLARLVEEGGIEAPVGPPGSLILFECNTMHGSNSNITPLPRSNVFLCYNSVANTLAAPFAAPKPRPDFIAERGFTPLEPV